MKKSQRGPVVIVILAIVFVAYLAATVQGGQNVGVGQTTTYTSMGSTTTQGQTVQAAVMQGAVKPLTGALKGSLVIAYTDGSQRTVNYDPSPIQQLMQALSLVKMDLVDVETNKSIKSVSFTPQVKVTLPSATSISMTTQILHTATLQNPIGQVYSYEVGKNEVVNDYTNDNYKEIGTTTVTSDKIIELSSKISTDKPGQWALEITTSVVLTPKISQSTGKTAFGASTSGKISFTISTPSPATTSTTTATKQVTTTGQALVSETQSSGTTIFRSDSGVEIYVIKYNQTKYDPYKGSTLTLELDFRIDNAQAEKYWNARSTAKPPFYETFTAFDKNRIWIGELGGYGTYLLKEGSPANDRSIVTGGGMLFLKTMIIDKLFHYVFTYGYGPTCDQMEAYRRGTGCDTHIGDDYRTLCTLSIEQIKSLAGV